MQAYEFTAVITPEGKVDIPAAVSAKLPIGRPVRLIVLIAEDDDTAWQRLTAEQFFAGYAEADSVFLYSNIRSGFQNACQT